MFDMSTFCLMSQIQAYFSDIWPCAAVVAMMVLYGSAAVASMVPVPLEVRGIDVSALSLPSPWLTCMDDWMEAMMIMIFKLNFSHILL